LAAAAPALAAPAAGDAGWGVVTPPGAAAGVAAFCSASNDANSAEQSKADPAPASAC